MSKFQSELEKLINIHNLENGSNTPDFILAQYIMECVETFNKTTLRRDWWHEKPIYSYIVTISDGEFEKVLCSEDDFKKELFERIKTEINNEKVQTQSADIDVRFDNALSRLDRAGEYNAGGIYFQMLKPNLEKISPTFHKKFEKEGKK